MKETRFKQTEIGLVPEEWKVVRLGEICSLKRGVRVTRSILTGNGKYPVFQNTSLPLGFYHTYNVLANTPFIIVGGSAGQVGICSSNYWAADDCVSINSTGKTNNFFLYYSLLFLQRLINSNVRNASVPRLDQTTIKNLEILLPPLAEQSRIAGALSSVDGLLSSLSRLIEKKRALRTAAMQQLLTAKTRLPGFDEPWKEVRLGDYFDIGNGYTPSKANPAYWTNGTIPWFRMEDIRTNGRILNDSIQHITPEAVKGSGLFPKGSIILSTTATIGEHALLIADSLANQRFSFLVRKLNRAEEIDIMYFFYQCFALGDWCRENINEGGLAAVNMEDLKNYLISLPSLPEQYAIAAVLSSMDSELAALEAKRAKVEGLRTGMMQQLLSGRLRLTEEAAERKQKTKPLE